MKIPTRLIEFLDQHHVCYEIVHHPIAFTAQELSAIEGVKGHEHAKVVMAKAGPRLVMLVLPSDCRVDWERVEKMTGAPVQLAGEADFAKSFPDCEVGTMPPFGLLYGVAMYVDEQFAQNVRVVFEAGTHSDAVKMKGTDYVRLAQSPLVSFAVKLL